MCHPDCMGTGRAGRRWTQSEHAGRAAGGGIGSSTLNPFFFDGVDHDLALKAVAAHTDQAWILLYVERWLKAPLQHQDGTLVLRDRGTPSRFGDLARAG